MDSARVVYRTPGGLLQATPYQAVHGDSGRIVTLGLAPSTTYAAVVEAIGSNTPVHSAAVQLVAGSLPPTLGRITFNVTGQPAAGYTMTTVSLDSVPYVLAFDSVGRIRWYRAFDRGVLAGETKQHTNGHFTTFVGNTFGWQPTYGRYVEYLPSGEIVASHAAAAPYYTDNHELLFTVTDGEVNRVHLFGYDLRSVNLSGIGGAADVLLAGHTIIRETPSGQVEFFWNAWDHFVLDDWIEEPGSLKQSPNIDFDHPNSLDIDQNGDYVVSWRGLAEITKINARTGGVIWRFGGRNNQFSILNDPLNGFSGQHSVRVLANEHLLLFDNGLRHNPPESRAAEYALDTSAMTATLVWQFRHNPPVYTAFTGSVQRRGNGNTVIGFAGEGRVTEVTPAGAVIWEGQVLVDGSPASLYRLTTVPSLYRYEVP